MRLSGRRSSNVEDRRGMSVPLVAGGGIGTVVLVLVALFLGVDPSEVVQTSSPTADLEGSAPAADDPQAQWVAGVLGETEATWEQIFRNQLERNYEPATLVIYENLVQSECGLGQAASGPFYCPLDGKVYLDLVFFRELEERFGAPGDFARAYVIAHEIGHHVQTLLGISQQVRTARARASEAEGNQLSVRQELQADCFAGVWANHANRERQILEQGDVQEGLAAASAIGDDRLQRQSQGHVVPETFTHGTSAQRVEWFRRGLDTGDVASCDTFGGM